jgi:hypothetical protein
MDCFSVNSSPCQHQEGPDCGACAALQTTFESGERRQWASLADVPEGLRMAHQAPEQEEMQRNVVNSDDTDDA